jgi:hypothetical protein
MFSRDFFVVGVPNGIKGYMKCVRITATTSLEYFVHLTTY